jgi:hypothetical protein
VADYYDNKARTFGATPRGADWRDAESQELRFELLSQIIHQPSEYVSVAEVGCGWGAFPLWAERQGYKITYTGYDIAEVMLQEARKICANLTNASFVKSDRPLAPADYVIASGIFNVRFNASDQEWFDVVKSTIAQMYNEANRGIAFNFLTSFSDENRKEARLYYADPGLILNYCISVYGRNVVLNHNCSLYEFTVLILKP